MEGVYKCTSHSAALVVAGQPCCMLLSDHVATVLRCPVLCYAVLQRPAPSYGLNAWAAQAQAPAPRQYLQMQAQTSTV